MILVALLLIGTSTASSCPSFSRWWSPAALAHQLHLPDQRSNTRAARTLSLSLHLCLATKFRGEIIFKRRSCVFSSNISLVPWGTTDDGIKASKKDLHNKVNTSLDGKGGRKKPFQHAFGSATPKIAKLFFFCFPFLLFFFCLYLPCAIIFHFVSFRLVCFFCPQELVDVVFPSFWSSN